MQEASLLMAPQDGRYLSLTLALALFFGSLEMLSSLPQHYGSLSLVPHRAQAAQFWQSGLGPNVMDSLTLLSDKQEAHMITNSRVKSAHPFSPSSSIAGFKGGRKRDTVRYISWNHSLIFESWQSFPRSNHLTFEFYIGKHKTDLLLMSTYKMHNMQVASLSFIWDKMRTAARETALRNCSQEAGRKVSVYELLVTGEYMKPATYSSRRFLLVS